MFFLLENFILYVRTICTYSTVFGRTWRFKPATLSVPAVELRRIPFQKCYLFFSYWKLNKKTRKLIQYNPEILILSLLPNTRIF